MRGLGTTWSGERLPTPDLARPPSQRSGGPPKPPDLTGSNCGRSARDGSPRQGGIRHGELIRAIDNATRATCGGQGDGEARRSGTNFPDDDPRERGRPAMVDLVRERGRGGARSGGGRPRYISCCSSPAAARSSGVWLRRPVTTRTTLISRTSREIWMRGSPRRGALSKATLGVRLARADRKEPIAGSRQAP